MKFQRRASSVFVLASTLALVLAALPSPVGAQPTLGVASVNGPCASGPTTLPGGAPDTLDLPADAQGFVPMFDGKSMKGWWEGCGGSHATDKANGGIWIADSTNQAIYSMQAANGSGSILTTNKSYTHYEMIFDFWASFESDAGVFNRTPANWRCYQTTLDYINGSSVGGAYGENNFANHNIDYYTFNGGGGANITVPTGARSWTTLTSLHNPTSFGCPSTGCTATQWTTVWNTADWNQVRIKFYGGLVAGQRPKMKAWVRKLSNPLGPWVPTYDDSLLPTNSTATPANPIGLQIHSGSDRWNETGKGAWYRNIKIRPLTEFGDSIAPTAIRRGALGSGGGAGARLRLIGGELVGDISAAHRITVRDLRGRVLERFSGAGGTDLHYGLADGSAGLLMVDIETEHGVDRLRLSRI
jgi:hypothetical protein